MAELNERSEEYVPSDKDFDDFMNVNNNNNEYDEYDDDSSTHEGAYRQPSPSPFDDTPSAPKGASTTNILYIQNKTYYDTAVHHTYKVIEDAIKKIKTYDGLFALYKVILKHYNSIQNHSIIPDPPDETTTDFTSDIFSDENYRQIMDETELIAIVNRCLSSLYTMCSILYSYNNGIYIDYSLKMNDWLRMILRQIQHQRPPSTKSTIHKKQQPPSKKAKKGGKSRRRHRKTKRKPYSRRR